MFKSIKNYFRQRRERKLRLWCLKNSTTTISAAEKYAFIEHDILLHSLVLSTYDKAIDKEYEKITAKIKASLCTGESDTNTQYQR